MFRKKTDKEKEIRKLELELYRLKKKRDFLMPRVREHLFTKNTIEDISLKREREIIKYDNKIINLQSKIKEKQS